MLASNVRVSEAAAISTTRRARVAGHPRAMITVSLTNLNCRLSSCQFTSLFLELRREGPQMGIGVCLMRKGRNAVRVIFGTSLIVGMAVGCRDVAVTAGSPPVTAITKTATSPALTLTSGGSEQTSGKARSKKRKHQPPT